MTISGVAAIVGLHGYAATASTYGLSITDAVSGTELYRVYQKAEKTFTKRFRAAIDVPGGSVTLTKIGGIGGWSAISIAYIPREASVNFART